MSILISATFEQEQKIKALSEYLSEQVLVRYIPFSVHEKVPTEPLFHIDETLMQHIETLQDASNVITALNTIISILEARSLSPSYQMFFNESIHTLAAYHIPFPLSFSFFLAAKPAYFA